MFPHSGATAGHDGTQGGVHGHVPPHLSLGGGVFPHRGGTAGHDGTQGGMHGHAPPQPSLESVVFPHRGETAGHDGTQGGVHGHTCLHTGAIMGRLVLLHPFWPPLQLLTRCRVVITTAMTIRPTTTTMMIKNTNAFICRFF